MHRSFGYVAAAKFPPITWDNAKHANRLHNRPMQDLIEKANQVILEAQWLRREGRSLRTEASARVSQLGQARVRARATENEFLELKSSLDQCLFD